MFSENLSPNLLRPIFSQALSLKLETIKLDAFIRNFSAGQTLAGKVVQVLPGQKAVVEFQGEKLLLQFPRPVSPGQNITVKIEQVHPNPVLKLTELSLPEPSQRTAPADTPTPPQASDKTSIQNRPAPPPHGETVTLNTPEPVLSETQKPGGKISGGKDPFPPLDIRTDNSISPAELKRLGIEAGHKVKAEVVRVVDQQTLRVRLPVPAITQSNQPIREIEITVKNTANFQPGRSVILHARPSGTDKIVLEVEPTPAPPAPPRSSPGLSILKNYLPARQSLIQVFSGLKEIFLDGPATPLKALNLEPGQLEQLQANLQKLVSREFKPLDAPRLQEVVDRSGLHYEAKVRDFVSNPVPARKNILLENDLKGQLMRLARQLEQMPAPAVETSPSDKWIGRLIAQVNHAVSNIELQQLVHYFAKEAHQPLLLQLPEQLLGENARFKIYIFPDPGEDSGNTPNLRNRAFNLVFLLHLSALGELRIETRVYQNEISIHITGSNADAVQFIQAHVPELEAPLREQGFSLSVTSRHQDEVPMAVPDSLDQLLIDHPLQLVDVKT